MSLIFSFVFTLLLGLSWFYFHLGLLESGLLPVEFLKKMFVRLSRNDKQMEDVVSRMKRLMVRDVPPSNGKSVSSKLPNGASLESDAFREDRILDDPYIIECPLEDNRKNVEMKASQDNEPLPPGIVLTQVSLYFEAFILN